MRRGYISAAMGTTQLACSEAILEHPPLAVGCPTLAWVADPTTREAVKAAVGGVPSTARDRALLVFSERLNSAGLASVRLIEAVAGARPIFRLAVDRVPSRQKTPARDLGSAVHAFEIPAASPSALVVEEPADDPLPGPVSRLDLDRAPEIPLRGRWSVGSKALGNAIQSSWVFGAVEAAGSWPSVWFPAEQPAPELDFENWQAVYGYTREDAATLAGCQISRVVRLHGRAVVIVDLHLRPYAPARTPPKHDAPATLHAVAFERTERAPVMAFEVTPAG